MTLLLDPVTIGFGLRSREIVDSRKCAGDEAIATQSGVAGARIAQVRAAVLIGADETNHPSVSRRLVRTNNSPQLGRNSSTECVIQPFVSRETRASTTFEVSYHDEVMTKLLPSDHQATTEFTSQFSI